MKAPSPDPPTSTFVVRFWCEWSVAGARWRGQVDHVQSGESARFLDLEDLLEILQHFGISASRTRQPDYVRGCHAPGQREGDRSDADVEAGSDRDT
jgi:hypothetical protein